MKKKLGIFLAIVMTVTSMMPVMASEPVNEEAAGAADNAFSVTVGSETHQYPADKFIEVMDEVTGSADADTKIDVCLNEDIDCGENPVMIWNGDVELKLMSNTLTSGGDLLYDLSRGIDDYDAWHEYAQNWIPSDAAVIVGRNAKLTLSAMTGGAVAVHDLTEGSAIDGIVVAGGGVLEVGRDVKIVSTADGIYADAADVIFKGEIEAKNSGGVINGISVSNGSKLTVEGGKISAYLKNSVYDGYGINIDESDFVMKGGEITVDTESTACGVYKYNSDGRFEMSGAKSGSSSKEDIIINVKGCADITGGIPTAVGVYVNEYSGADPLFIKNTRVTSYSESGGEVGGIRIDSAPGTDVTIENCAIDATSEKTPTDEYDASKSVFGIMHCVNGGDSNFSSVIKNVVVNCESNGDVHPVRGYDIDGARITGVSHGLFFMPSMIGIDANPEKEISIKNTTVKLSGKNAAAFGLHAWLAEGKDIVVGNNCVIDVSTMIDGRALSTTFYDEGTPERVKAADGKWYDKNGKTVDNLMIASYLKTTAKSAPSKDPTEVPTSISKAKFTWGGDVKGSAKAPYLSFDGSEKIAGFTLESRDGSETFEEGIDYTVTYTHSKRDMTKPGKVTVSIKATEGGRLKGSLTKRYTIKPAKLADIYDDPLKSEDDGNPLIVEVNEGSPAVYDPKGVRPEVMVTYGGELLEAGKDYKIVKYINNKAASTSSATRFPMVMIKGKGNFVGTIKAVFDIEPKYITDELENIDIKDVLSGKNFVSKPVIKDGKKKLKTGRDYTLRYSLSSNMIAEVPDGAKPEAGTEIFVKITGNGNYQGPWIVSYFVREAMLNKCTATIKEGAELPTWAEDVTADMLTVTKNKSSKDPMIPFADYDIEEASYIRGSVDYLKVTIVGGSNNLYGGKRTVNIRLAK